MQVGRSVDNANSVALVGPFLNGWQQMAGKHDVTEVVASHVKIDAVVFRELSSHDTSGGVVHENVDSVGLRGDLCGNLAGLHPVGKITLLPDELLAGFGSELFCDCVQCFVDDFLPQGKNEELGDVAGKKSMCDTETNTFATTSDYSNLLLLSIHVQISQALDYLPCH